MASDMKIWAAQPKVQFTRVRQLQILRKWQADLSSAMMLSSRPQAVPACSCRYVENLLCSELRWLSRDTYAGLGDAWQSCHKLACLALGESAIVHLST